MLKIINKIIMLFLCCFFSINVNATDIINEPQIITEWQLIDINYYLNGSSGYEKAEQLIDNLQKTSVKSTSHQLILNNKSAINIKKYTDSFKGLSADTLQLWRDILTRLNLTDVEKNTQYFTFVTSPNQYNLNKPLVFISDYLFLFTNDELILVFKSKDKMCQELAAIYNNLNTSNLPLVNRYYPPKDQDGFLSVPDEFNYFFKGMLGDDSYQAIKLNKFNDKNLLLLSSYAASGAPYLKLISLSENFNLIDILELSTQYELEDGFSNVYYSIDKNYHITIKEIEYRNDKQPKLLSEKHYVINNAGKFIDLKK